MGEWLRIALLSFVSVLRSRRNLGARNRFGAHVQDHLDRRPVAPFGVVESTRSNRTERPRSHLFPPFQGPSTTPGSASSPLALILRDTFSNSIKRHLRVLSIEQDYN